MNTLDRLNVPLLIGAAVLLAMACVKADRVRAWRDSINPSAPEVPDSAFVAARVVLVTMAGIGVYTAVQGFGDWTRSWVFLPTTTEKAGGRTPGEQLNGTALSTVNRCSRRRSQA
ncbi:hypothetical protein ACIQB5_42700 [Streptomyces sp. NPDC088560]|uniref:hypothetical protein n=1 Tax=Streptomyces sp. NPDC088560 TaxID=3365868 RepID=UPI00380F447B